MPELLKLRLRFCMGFENPLWFNIAFNSVATQLYLLLPDKFFCPPNLNLNIKTQFPYQSQWPVIYTLLCPLCHVKMGEKGKIVMRSLDGTEKKSSSTLEERFNWAKVKNWIETPCLVHPWRIHSPAPLLAGSNVSLHFGHGPLRRPFHCSVKRTPLTQGDWSALLC